MAMVSAALLIGILTGAFLRPFLDAYLEWRLARTDAPTGAESPVYDEPLFREPSS